MECLNQEKETILRKLRDTAKAERHAAVALATNSQGLVQPQGLFTMVGDLGRICFMKPFAVFPSLPAPQVYRLSAKETQELQLAQKTPMFCPLKIIAYNFVLFCSVGSYYLFNKGDSG